MTVKFNQYWIIDHEKAAGYGGFIINKYIPTLNQLGIHTVAGWTVIVGGYSEIIFEGVSNDLDLLEKALRDEKYKSVHDELQDYIKSYKTKVLVSTGKMETYSTNISKNTVKFNQMWDVISSRKSDYEKYVLEMYYPCLEGLGIHVAGEWEVFIGDSPRTICEGRFQESNGNKSLISNLCSDAFLRAQKKLKQFVYHYESRILTFHIQKVLGYKTASYELIAN